MNDKFLYEDFPKVLRDSLSYAQTLRLARVGRFPRPTRFSPRGPAWFPKSEVLGLVGGPMEANDE